MRRQTITLCSSISSLVLITTAPAHAQDPANVEDIRDRICLKSALDRAPDAMASRFNYGGKQWQRVTNERAAFYIISELGIVASPAEALTLVDAAASDEVNADFAIRTTLEELSKDLKTYQSDFKLRAFDQSGVAFSDSNSAGFRPNDFGWFLAPRFTLACEIGDAPTADTGSGEKAETGRTVLASLRLRGDVADLSVDGEKRKTASALTLGFDRVREFKEDGSRTETRSTNFKGAVGILLTAHEKRELPNLLAFVAYEQNTSNIRDLLPETTGATPVEDDETKLLQFGLTGSNIFPINGYDTSLQVAVETGYLIDFTDSSERVRLNLTSSLYDFYGIKGLTGIGRYKNYLASTLWTRLDIEAIANFNVLTNLGDLEAIEGKTFGHVGGRIAFSAALGKTYSDGPFFTAEYLRLGRIKGDPSFIPHINRHQFTLGNRWWFGDDFAIEVSAKLLDGENADSFADENQISVNFGLIF